MRGGIGSQQGLSRVEAWIEVMRGEASGSLAVSNSTISQTSPQLYVQYRRTTDFVDGQN